MFSEVPGGLNLSEIVYLTANPYRQVTKGTSDLLLAGEFRVFVIAENIGQHILAHGDRVGLGNIPLGELTNYRLISLEPRN